MTILRPTLAAILAAILLSCSSDPALDGSGTPGTGGSSPGVDSGIQDGDLPDSESGAMGPRFILHVVTGTDTFDHQDAYSGQTSRQTSQGIRSFSLYRQPDDPSPVVVFDYGTGFVEAGYDPGDDTVVGSSASGVVPAGRYTMARFGVTHSRYRVYSTLHYAGGAYAGDFDCVQALSDDTTIDGVSRQRGWYRYVFEYQGDSYPQEGSNAPLPTSPETGGFKMITVGGQTYYEYAIDLTVPEAIETDFHVGLLVNMFESFRWEDQALPGYQPDVYDTTPVSFEPVRRFGANAAMLVVLANP